LRTPNTDHVLRPDGGAAQHGGALHVPHTVHGAELGPGAGLGAGPRGGVPLRCSVTTRGPGFALEQRVRGRLRGTAHAGPTVPRDRATVARPLTARRSDTIRSTREVPEPFTERGKAIRVTRTRRPLATRRSDAVRAARRGGIRGLSAERGREPVGFGTFAARGRRGPVHAGRTPAVPGRGG